MYILMILSTHWALSFSVNPKCCVFCFSLIEVGWLLAGNTVWHSCLFSLQGIDSAISASQPFLLITKPLEMKKKEHTLLGSSERFFFSFGVSSARFEAKSLDETNTCTWKAEEMIQVPFAQESSNPKLRHLFSSCVEECAVSRHQLCRALPNPLWFYLYVFP